MSTPVKFADIGKATNDLLNKDFPIGIVRVEGKGSEKMAQKVVSKFNVLGTRDMAAGSLAGEVKNTLTCFLSRPSSFSDSIREKSSLVLESTTTIGSLGTLAQQFELKDTGVKGLSVSATGTVTQAEPFQVKTGLGYAKTCSKNCLLNTHSSVDLFKGPTIAHDTALRFGDFLVGGQVAYNVNKAKLDQYAAAIGFDLPYYKATVHGTNGFNTLTAAFYQKFTSGIETGYRATWNRKTGHAFGIEVVSKFPLEPGSFLKAKLDNHGKLGISYSSLVNTKVALTLAGSFDTFKMENGHRVGLALVIDI